MSTSATAMASTYRARLTEKPILPFCVNLGRSQRSKRASVHVPWAFRQRVQVRPEDCATLPDNHVERYARRPLRLRPKVVSDYMI